RLGIGRLESVRERLRVQAKPPWVLSGATPEVAPLFVGEEGATTVGGEVVATSPPTVLRNHPLFCKRFLSFARRGNVGMLAGSKGGSGGEVSSPCRVVSTRSMNNALRQTTLLTCLWPVPTRKLN